MLKQSRSQRQVGSENKNWKFFSSTSEILSGIKGSSQENLLSQSVYIELEKKDRILCKLSSTNTTKQPDFRRLFFNLWRLIENRNSGSVILRNALFESVSLWRDLLCADVSCCRPVIKGRLWVSVVIVC